ncbi:MAG: DUF7546 family protein [Halanaeroarchaeum sp.]
MSTTHSALDARRLDGETIATWTLVLFTEFLLVAGYLAFSSTSADSIRYVVYPFVWINVGVLAAASIDPEPQNTRHRTVGLLVAAGYFLVLLYTASNVGPNPLSEPWSFDIALATPGWGPLLVATGPGFSLTPIPFEVIGYAALSYLLYANVLRISRSVLAGALGLVTCVGCTVPILAPAIGLLGGPASSLTTTAYQYSYDLGTVLFVVTVAILYASAAGTIPTLGRLNPRGDR